jgi:hypothetical protein
MPHTGNPVPTECEAGYTTARGFVLTAVVFFLASGFLRSSQESRRVAPRAPGTGQARPFGDGPFVFRAQAQEESPGRWHAGQAHNPDRRATEWIRTIQH